MMNKYYLDTSIWLDYYERRGKNGEATLKLIRKITEEGDIILYSNAIVKELKHLGYFLTEISEILNIAQFDNIKLIQIHERQIEEAEKIALQRNLPKRDVLHAVLARDNEACLITRDNHFQKLKDITVSKLPEDFI